MMGELNSWLDESIRVYQDKIDIAANRSWHDVKYRSEGYLEALYQIQKFIKEGKEKMKIAC